MFNGCSRSSGYITVCVSAGYVSKLGRGLMAMSAMVLPTVI